MTYTSAALYRNAITSKARFGSRRSHLFLGTNDAELDHDASLVNLLRL